MNGFDALNELLNGTSGSEKFAEDLKGPITDLLGCTNEMLARVPQEVLRDMSVLCAKYGVELAFNTYHKEDEPKYQIIYFNEAVSGNEIIAATSNKGEEERLDNFNVFLARRYGFKFSYAYISFDQKQIELHSGEYYDKVITEKLIKHLELAFPDKTFAIS